MLTKSATTTILILLPITCLILQAPPHVMATPRDITLTANDSYSSNNSSTVNSKEKINEAKDNIMSNGNHGTVAEKKAEDESEEQEQEEGYDTNAYHGNLSRETIAKIRKCEIDQERMELCMRCAKITKAVLVYPLCCNDEDNVKQWCHDYIYYGTAS